MVSRRLWATCVLLLIPELGVLYVQHGYAPAAVALPPYQVTELPIRLGAWQSESVPTDFRIARATGADEIQERVYYQSNQSRVSAHFGLWSDPDSRAPHLPQACYSGGGWTSLAEEVIHIGDPSKPKVAAALTTWEREGERVRTLHWYRRGDQTYSDWDGGCRVHRELWGRASWPAVEKVLLQTVDDDKDASRTRLVEVAVEIDRWMQAAR